jgi:ribosomal protein L32
MRIKYSSVFAQQRDQVLNKQLNDPAEVCPQCGNFTLEPRIDPELGRYVQCKDKTCNFTLTAASMKTNNEGAD